MIILAFYEGRVDYKALRIKVNLIGNNLGLQYSQRLELRKVLRIDEKIEIILLSLFSVES
jgi:hypothetical protein